MGTTLLYGRDEMFVLTQACHVKANRKVKNSIIPSTKLTERREMKLFSQPRSRSPRQCNNNNTPPTHHHPAVALIQIISVLAYFIYLTNFHPYQRRLGLRPCSPYQGVRSLCSVIILAFVFRLIFFYRLSFEQIKFES